eukprot:gene5992-biopygen17797
MVKNNTTKCGVPAEFGDGGKRGGGALVLPAIADRGDSRGGTHRSSAGIGARVRERKARGDHPFPRTRTRHRHGAPAFRARSSSAPEGQPAPKGMAAKTRHADAGHYYLPPPV